MRPHWLLPHSAAACRCRGSRVRVHARPCSVVPRCSGSQVGRPPARTLARVLDSWGTPWASSTSHITSTLSPPRIGSGTTHTGLPRGGGGVEEGAAGMGRGEEGAGQNRWAWGCIRRAPPMQLSGRGLWERVGSGKRPAWCQKAVARAASACRAARWRLPGPTLAGLTAGCSRSCCPRPGRWRSRRKTTLRGGERGVRGVEGRQVAELGAARPAAQPTAARRWPLHRCPLRLLNTTGKLTDYEPTREVLGVHAGDGLLQHLGLGAHLVEHGALRGGGGGWGRVEGGRCVLRA